ncbi:CHAT domain-containing protein [Boletus coccyginus]|nr:CHAT domain-containing protein [Boletus coccyginus]
MSTGRIPLDKAELLSVLLETLLYGFSLLMFGGTIWTLLSQRSTRQVNRKMFAVAFLLLLTSTAHLVIHIIRVMCGLILHRDTYPGGPVAYFSDVSQWTFYVKNQVYIAQTVVGDGVISKLVMIFPLLLWCAAGVTGFVSGAITEDTTQSGVFSGALNQWGTSFWVTALAANLLATLMLIFRIWYIDRKLTRLGASSGGSQLRPILQILVDAGAIYSVTLLVALICFVIQSNGQYVVLDMGGVQTPGVPDPHPECGGKEEGKEEIPGPGDQLAQDVPTPSGAAMHTDSIEKMAITNESPPGFMLVHHSGLEWRTENKRSSVNHDVVMWDVPIPIPLDPSATICLKVYASFELQATLGAGEQLRELPFTVKELLGCSAKDVPFALFPMDGDVTSPCSSILVTAKRWRSEGNDSSASVVLAPHCSATESLGELEDATNQGHRALSRYKKHGEKRDLERSIEQFESALSICPLDHRCLAAAQSNLAMVKFILCQVEDMNTPLEVPLGLYRDALAARPIGHLDRPSTLLQLALVHCVRFGKQRDEAEKARAEALLHEAMELSTTDSHENRAATFVLQLCAVHRGEPVRTDGRLSVEQHSALRSLDEDPCISSVQLLHRFERFGDLANLQQAITILEELLRSNSIGDDRHSKCLGDLGAALSYRFGHLGELSDLENAIPRFRDAIEFTPRGHPDKPGRLNNLGNSLLIRFERLGEFSDLEDAVSRIRDAVELTPHGHPDKPFHLGNLGNSFRARFESLGELSDLADAISKQRDAVELTPHGYSRKPIIINNLGDCLLARFERLGEFSDLEDAISRFRDAVELTPHGHPHKCSLLNNLGTSFQAPRRDALELTPHGHPHNRLSNLGTSLLTRFERLGQLSDLEDAISAHRDAVELPPQGHPHKPDQLNNLGTSFRARFERLGELSDLEDAISRLRDAVELTPHGHPHKLGLLNNLGNSFLIRFERLGQLSDLEDGISAHRDAVKLIPHGHPYKPGQLNNLGNSLRTRFERLGELSDLEDAISALMDAVELTPHGHPDQPSRLNNLGTSLLTRFERLGQLSDLEDAISAHRDAVELTPHGHPHKPGQLNNLGTSFRARFERLGQLSDLEDAISAYRDAIKLTPHGHPHKLNYLDNLGGCLVLRFRRLGQLSDVEQAIFLYSHAASAPIGPISVRFRASQAWISSARDIHHHSLFDACYVAITLLPQLPWIGLSLTHRYSELARGADVMREVAAVALDLDLLDTTVEWLEQGRSIVWGELFQLRSAYEELSSAYPDHARRLRELSAALEHASAAHEKSLSALSEQTQSASHHATPSLQVEAHRHRTFAIERDKLLHEIRGFPGFGRFLLHKEFFRLRASAHSGPVVILNAAETRCDALIVLADVDHVVHVPLPNFTFERSTFLQNMLEKLLGHSRDIHPDERKAKLIASPHNLHTWDPETPEGDSWEFLLSNLWKGVVRPVLDSLAFQTPGDPSRIFWCPTGPFVFLPIHGAGLYDTQHAQPGYHVSDFVVSSYIPTLSILTLPSDFSTPPSGDLRLLVVRQPSSDGLHHLSGVATELTHIREVIRDSPSVHITLVESSDGTAEEVLSLMHQADWVHFACHGIQDAASPTNSGLCLADGRRLSLRDIIEVSRPRGGLAFLSACQTAMGDEHLSNESIHIAAGMLFVGYGGVVGTMWKIDDELAPRVARDVYGQLFRNCTRPDYREAARALHQAIGRLRHSNASFAGWLPFIHVGL